MTRRRTTTSLALAAALSTSIARAQCETQELLVSDATQLDSFARVLASDGERVLASSWGVGVGLGSVYVLERGPQGWMEVDRLNAVGGQPSDVFGWSIAIDGEVAVVGAWGAAGGRGSAYVFERAGDDWQQTAELVPPDGMLDDAFGSAVAVSGDVVAVGSPNDSNPVWGFQTGSVYVFERDGAGWSATQKVEGPAPASGDRFGDALALDGDTLVVGAPYEDTVGSVHVFQDTILGFLPLQELAPSDAGPAGDEFGYALALDGDRLVVGAPEKHGVQQLQGAAYVFAREDGGWVEMQIVDPPVPSNVGLFGSSVDLRDGRIAVGAPLHSAPCGDLSDPACGTGRADVFELVLGSWVHAGAAVPQDLANADQFGGALALAGAELVVGSPYDDTYFADAGALYAFDLAFTACLRGSVTEISIPTGGAQLWTLEAGAAHAGAPYLVLGSASGTAPGLVLDGLELPLVFDGYTSLTLLGANQPPLNASFGALDAAGNATASFALPPASLGLHHAGVVLHHAAVVFDVAPALVVVGATSNALALELVSTP